MRTKKCQRLFLCYQYAGTIRFKNRMGTRAAFAEFEEILIADWQYDELEIPLTLHFQFLPIKKANITVHVQFLSIKKTNITLHVQFLPIKKANITLHVPFLPIKKANITLHVQVLPIKF